MTRTNRGVLDCGGRDRDRGDQFYKKNRCRTVVQVRVVPHWSTLCLCENVYPSLLACAPPLWLCAVS